jgi:hypothetical protein
MILTTLYLADANNTDNWCARKGDLPWRGFQLLGGAPATRRPAPAWPPRLKEKKPYTNQQVEINAMTRSKAQAIADVE